VPESDDATRRQVIVGKYRVIYRVDDSVVTILAVIHGARDFGRMMRERE